MLRHFLELVFRPGRDGVNVAILVSHEIQLVSRHSDGFAAYAEEASYIQDDLAAVHVGHRPDFFVVRAIDRGTFQCLGNQFIVGKPYVSGVVHLSLQWLILPNPRNSELFPHVISLGRYARELQADAPFVGSASLVRSPPLKKPGRPQRQWNEGAQAGR
jgi:hypothetical protein